MQQAQQGRTYAPYQITSADAVPVTLIESLRPLARFRKQAVGERVGDATRETRPIQVLALSAGGVFGAYGAGFLVGWSSRDAMYGDARPTFDIVTGVSTGAILAPFAFLGRSYDPMLLREYGEKGLSDEEIVEKRATLSLLTANSLFTIQGGRALLERYIDNQFIDAVAAEREKRGRSLLAGAVNLDSGMFTIFDLTQLAADRALPERRKLFIDILMAAAAIPVVFPPVFVAGEMYTDGGVREHVLLSKVQRAYARAAASEGLVPATPRLYMFVHSDLVVPTRCTPNGLIGIGQRTFNVIVDHLLKASAFRAAYIAKERERMDLRMVDASRLSCRAPESDDVFSAPLSQCLFKEGAARAKQADVQWKTKVEDLTAILDEATEHWSPGSLQRPVAECKGK